MALLFKFVDYKIINMKKLLLLPIILLAFAACKKEENPESFSKAALQDKMTAIDGTEMSFKDVLEQYKTKPIVIDVWASWCPDCIKGMPKLQALQEQFPDVVYLFLSYDKTPESWREGIDKYGVKGEHYLIGSEWKGGAFSEAINLDWIPRYMVVDSEGKIALFRAIEADDEKLIATLNTIK